MNAKVTMVFLVAVLLAMAASPVAADPYEDGLAAFNKSDYANAIKLFEPLADQGDPRAQIQLGIIYYLGLGTSKDSAKAAMLYRKAADQGSAIAQQDLAELYFFGDGVAQDYGLAAKWYLRAANQGNAISLYKLGLMAAKGQGIPQDNVQAYRWLKDAVSRYPSGTDRDSATKALNVVGKNLTAAELAEAQRPIPVAIDADTVGTWEIRANGGRWVLEIDADDTYKFHSEAPDGIAPHAGTFSANGGHWSLQATNGYSDGGSYTFQPPDSLAMSGRLGTGTWHRAASATSN